MKLDPKILRYLSATDFRVLTGVEMGMKNHELVPTPLIEKIAGLKRGGAYSALQTIHKHKLVYHDSTPYDGYKLTYLGYDFLALKALSARRSVVSVGRQIGVGKESDIYVVVKGVPEESDGVDRDALVEDDSPQRDEEQEVCLKLHRLGRVSFKTVKQNRDYLRGRKFASWLYLSRLAALKEYAFMKVLYDNGFPVPVPYDVSRHCVVMELVNGVPLCNVRELGDPGDVYAQCIELLVKLARHGLIHGDFNEFNIMIRDAGDIVLIDFPQMVSSSHHNAKFYFDRDAECIKSFFARRYGWEADEPLPSFEEATRVNDRIAALDVQAEASGFDKKMQADLEALLGETKNEDGGGEEVEDEQDGKEEEDEEEDEEEESGEGEREFAEKLAIEDGLTIPPVSSSVPDNHSDCGPSKSLGVADGQASDGAVQQESSSASPLAPGVVHDDVAPTQDPPVANGQDPHVSKPRRSRGTTGKQQLTAEEIRKSVHSQRKKQRNRARAGNAGKPKGKRGPRGMDGDFEL